jgi:hypothetical protein
VIEIDDDDDDEEEDDDEEDDEEDGEEQVGVQHLFFPSFRKVPVLAKPGANPTTLK